MVTCTIILKEDNKKVIEISLKPTTDTVNMWDISALGAIVKKRYNITLRM